MGVIGSLCFTLASLGPLPYGQSMRKKSPPPKGRKILKTPKATSPKKSSAPIYARKCDDQVCCQAVTTSGAQCTRPAHIKIDLTRGIETIGVKGVDCCFYCTQHAKILAVTKLANFFHTYGTQVAKTLGGKNLSYDEYYAIFPEEISSSFGQG